MSTHKIVPSVAVLLKEGKIYHGPHLVEVTSLPKSLLGHLIMFLLFGAGLTMALLFDAPQWVAWILGLIAAEGFLNAITRAVQLVRPYVRQEH